MGVTLYSQKCWLRSCLFQLHTCTVYTYRLQWIYLVRKHLYKEIFPVKCFERLYFSSYLKRSRQNFMIIQWSTTTFLRLIWPLLTTLLWQLLSIGQDHLWKIKGTIEQNFCPFNIFWWVASVEKCESRRAAFPRKTLRYRLTRGESWSLADHRKNTAGADRDHAIIVSPSKSWSCDTFFMGFSFGLRSDKHQNTDCVFCFLLTLDSMITNMFSNVVGDWVEFLSRCSIFSFSTTNTQKGRAQEWLT